jgi:hypothetical protein
MRRDPQHTLETSSNRLKCPVPVVFMVRQSQLRACRGANTASEVMTQLLDTIEEETSVRGPPVVRSKMLREMAGIVKASQHQMARCVAYGRKIATAACAALISGPGKMPKISVPATINIRAAANPGVGDSPCSFGASCMYICITTLK